MQCGLNAPVKGVIQGCNSKTHNHWFFGSWWRSNHCGESIYVTKMIQQGAIDDRKPICEDCRGKKGGFKPKEKKKSKKRRKPTKRKEKEETNEKKGGSII